MNCLLAGVFLYPLLILGAQGDNFGGVEAEDVLPGGDGSLHEGSGLLDSVLAHSDLGEGEGADVDGENQRISDLQLVAEKQRTQKEAFSLDKAALAEIEGTESVKVVQQCAGRGGLRMDELLLSGLLDPGQSGLLLLLPVLLRLIEIEKFGEIG